MMHLKKQLGCYLFLLLAIMGFNNEPTSKYIERFKDIAIHEMQRTKIPASITLAQAIHESSWGKGELAVNSNNYFGIKCKKYWQGKKYFKVDDDFDEANKPIKSCFRAYPNIQASFEDHSNFLRNGERYAGLFQLEIMDYRAWAKGLQTCGYATDPQYAQKLIHTIEKYELYQFDIQEDSQEEIMEQPIYWVNLNLLEEHITTSPNRPQVPQAATRKITEEVRRWETRREKEENFAPSPVDYPEQQQIKKEQHSNEQSRKMIRMNSSNSRQIILKSKVSLVLKLRK